MAAPVPPSLERPLALPRFRAVVMDMDGLALDTEATYCTAWRSAAAELGFDLSPEFCRGLFGQQADDVKLALSQACGNRFDLAAFHASAARHWHTSLAANGVSPMPGLERLLSLLQSLGLPYALATNSDRPYAELCLRSAGVRSRFPVVVTRDQVARGKPAPDVFLEAARRLGVSPAECLALEDSPTGLSASIAAGMISVWIPQAHHREAAAPSNAIWILPALDDLTAHLEQLAA